MHRNGQVSTGGPLLPSIQRGIQEIPRTVVSHIEQIGQECTDATSIRLPSCSHNQEPSPPRIRRRPPIPFSTIKDGTLLLQVIPGGTGTRPKAGGAHEFNSFFNCLLQQVSLTADGDLL